MADDVSVGEPDPLQTEASSSADAGIRRGRRRSAYATRDLTKGSVPRNLWFLAWPQVAEGFLNVTDQLADLFWAGIISFQAIAGLGAAQTYVMTMMTARQGLDAGMRSMIARAIGARNVAYANHALLQSLTLTTVISLVGIAVALMFTEPLLRVLGLSDEVVEQAAGYMRLQFVAMSVMSYHRLGGGALQAAGDSMTPFKAATVSRVTHLVLSPLLIFGWLGLPDMGLAGAAAANLIAQLLGVGINFYALLRGTSRLRLSFRGFGLDLALIWRLVQIGTPASVTGMQRAVSQLIVVGIVAQFGDAAVAAFAVSRRAENLVNQASRGLGRAGGALVGQNLGAGDPGRARASLKWAMAYVVVGVVFIAAPLLAFPEAVASVFGDDPEFISLAATWLTILAIGYFSMSAVQVFTQAFNTSGNTLAPMVITLATMWAVELPLAFSLARYTSLGQFGVPWAVVIGMSLRLAAFVYYYRRGNWLRTGMM